MGAMPDAEKTAFRVWAPHAHRVAVVGSFNGWDGGRDPMEPEGDGCWYAEVAGARPGHEYRYLLETPEGELSRIDPRAREVTDSAGNGVIHDPAGFDWGPDAFRMPPRDELVIYELHIGTFRDKGREDGQPGTFRTAIERLDHLGKLGVNAIEIMPVVEFPGSRAWGYAPAHMFAVESSYGGPAALKALIKEGHRRGIAVILDVVYNHLGPKDVDLWRFDGWSENDLGGIYFFNDWRAETPWGHSRPDYSRAEVRRFIVDNALMWLDEYRIDGLRVDGTVFIRTADFSGDRPIPEGYSLLQEINTEVRRRFPGRLLIAEDLRENPEMTRPVEAGAGFDTQWDGKFAYEIRRSVITPVDEERSMQCVAEAIAAKYNDDAFQRIIYSESHDEVANGKARVPYEINKDDATGWYSQARSVLAATMVFTAPGIPMLFQGQEFLEGEWFREDVPLDWDMSRAFRGIVRLYRDLIALRLDRRGVTRGLRGQGVQVHRVDEERKVLAFRRWDRGGPGDDVVIVANFLHEPQHDYAIGFPAEGAWKVRFHSDWSGYSERFEGREGDDATAGPGECDGLPCRGAIAIAPYSALILSQDPK
jgi:1,4-alpha-glucan branching enzyme